MKPHHATEAAWVVGGQAATALGTLVGMRMLTQFMTPASFGALSLTLAAIVLVTGVASVPLTQAALHLYPTFAERGALRDLRTSLLRCLRRAGMWLLPLLCVAGVAYIVMGSGSPLLLVFAAVCLVSDNLRSVHTSMLNAARRHRRYSLWTSCDAWLRPLLATAAMVVFGSSATTAAGAYAVASVTLLLIFSSRLWTEAPAAAVDANRSPTPSAAEVDLEMWAYALPLLPLGLISWANNLGDRYFIGGTLGLESAGVYAAVYGLSSMPFTLIAGTIEQAVRPVYQTATATGRHDRANRLFQWWLLAVAAACAFGVLLFVLFHDVVAALLLAKPYRHASHLMPWIAAGYAMRATASVFERVCYAYGRTRRVLAGQTSAALIALVATPVGALGWGLAGAAAAVPLCFAIQLAVTIILARGALPVPVLRAVTSQAST